MKKLLDVINKHNGQWSWYQLERAFWGDPISQSGKFHLLLKQLESDGLIASQEVQGYPDPLYSITSKGLTVLQESKD
jgi:DNA-binding PadR family transcriptional regulator